MKPHIALAVHSVEMRNLIALAVAAAGAEVILSDNGIELVIQVSAHGAIDMVIADYRMPQATGLAAVRALRDTGFTAPALLLTEPQESAITSDIKAIPRAWILHRPRSIGDLFEVTLRVLAHLDDWRTEHGAKDNTHVPTTHAYYDAAAADALSSP